MLNYILGSSAVVSGVLLLLVLASVSSWAIMLMKFRELRRAEKDTEEFVEAYLESPLETAYEVARRHGNSPLATVFRAGYTELARLEKLQGGRAPVTRDQVEGVVSRLGWIQGEEVHRLERGLSFLATIASSGPFVGLFGTVVGIMNSFQAIGAVGLGAAGDGRPGHRRGAGRDGLRARRRDPGGGRLQLHERPAEPPGRAAPDVRHRVRRRAAAHGVARGMNVADGRGKRRQLSEINVTPFVDVMLVLLIIFMVTAPLMEQGIDVDLPKTQAKGLRSDTQPLIVTVKRDGQVFVQNAQVPLNQLGAKLEAIFETRGDKLVYLRADEKVAYGTVAKTLAILRGAGATGIGMVTEPEA